MAVINKLRNSGIVVIVIIFALAAFIIGDLISNYNRQGGQIDDNAVGFINGEAIQTGDYNALVSEYESNLLRQSQGKPIDESQKSQIRQQAWKKIFSDRVLLKEYDALGLTVTKEEMADWMFSKDPHPTIKYFFNPLFQEGEAYDHNKVQSTVQQMMQNPEAKNQIDQVYKAVQGDVLDAKYNAMVKNSIYATKLEAEIKLAESTETLEGKLVTLKISDINQDSLAVTDAELQAYLSKNKEFYKQEKSVDIEYVKWDIAASAQDSLTALKVISKAYNDLKNASNDSIYLDINSAKGYDTNYTAPSDLPLALSRNLGSLNKGDMYGPDFENGLYSVYKILGVQNDTNTYMNTSHILFKTGPGKQEEEIKAKANEMLSSIKKGTISWSDAVKQSEDFGSISEDGYIGWFTDDGKLVEEFVNFAKGKSKGEIGIAKSQFGYHIIKINENSTTKKVQYGVISQTIESGRETRKKVLDVATKFRRELQGKEENEFQISAEKNKLFPSIARNVEERSKQVSGVPNAKNITDWAFENEREEGDISPVLSIGNTEYVVHLTKKRDEGYAKLEDVRDALTIEVKKEKSLELLMTNMKKAMEGVNAIEQVAINLKTIAQDMNGYNVGQGNNPQVGNDNILRGYLAASKVKEMNGPIKGTEGVYAFIVTNKTKETIEDGRLEETRRSLMQEPQMSAAQLADQTLKKLVDFKDTRYKFEI